MKRVICLFGLTISRILLAAEPSEEALISAVKRDDVATVTEQVKLGVNPNIDVSFTFYESAEKPKEESFSTPLHYAATRGHGALVELLIKKGAAAKAKGASGETPLHLAALGGHATIANILIQNGADPNSRSYQGKRPIDLAKGLAQARQSPALIHLLKPHSYEFYLEQHLIKTPNFEFWNKDENTKSVRIALTLDKEDPKESEIYQAYYADKKDIIENSVRGKVDTSHKSLLLFVKKSLKDLQVYRITIPSSEATLYLRLKKDGSVGPQTGPLKGFKGVTESGLPLANNIKSEHIQLLSDVKMPMWMR